MGTRSTVTLNGNYASTSPAMLRYGVLALLLITAAWGFYHHDDVTLDREKRALIFGSNGVLQMMFGIAFPLDIPNRTVTINYGFQAQYNMPTNASVFEPLYVVNQARSARAIYQHVETTMLEKNCLLRTICQVAAEPLEKGGLLEELLMMLLTPSEEEGDSEGLREYLDAEGLGAVGGDCEATYPDCPNPPLDAYTTRIVEDQ